MTTNFEALNHHTTYKNMAQMKWVEVYYLVRRRKQQRESSENIFSCNNEKKRAEIWDNENIKLKSTFS